MGSILIIFGTFLASLTKSLAVFAGVYGIFVGVGSGINYWLPLIYAWQHYPLYIGRVTGILIAFY